MSADFPAEALDAVPVFPLPRVVLFPRAILPLHVFEPRYRQMLSDVLATHRCIVMAFVESDAREPPPFARVAGLGVVVEHERLPDGRSNILLQGRARVVLDELPFVAPYRRARARVLDELAGAVPNVERAALQSAATAFVAEVRRRDPEIDVELPKGVEPGVLADLCAQHLLLDPAARQSALEELDVGARVRAVTAELVAQVMSFTGPARGSTN